MPNTSATPSASKPMNVLFIIDDQHRADCLGYMGHPCVKTPNLDALAAQSQVFTRAFTPSPTCMAARGSLLTGRYPSSIGIQGMGILPPQETTTATLFQQAGYRTGAQGKLHLTPQLYTHATLGLDSPCLDLSRYAEQSCLAPAPHDPFKTNYGFEEHQGCDDTLKGNHLRWVKQHAPHLLDAKPIYPMPEVSKETSISPFTTEYHHSAYVASMTQDFITRHANTPWYAWCGFVAPHHPFEAPADQIARYDGIPMPQPASAPLTPHDNLIPAPASNAIGETDKYPPAYKDLVMRHYLASISNIDDRIGCIIQTLKDTHQYDNTIIVFTADHGEMAFEHGLIRKPSIHYDDTINVPLFIRIPGVAPRRINGLVELIDLHPTLLGLTHQPINPGVQGRDWSDALRTGQHIGRENIYSEMRNLGPMVCAEPHGPYMACVTLRTESWKLNLYPTAGQQYGQLFDLKNDPHENHNLYASDTHASLRHQMTWQLLERTFQNADPLPLRLTQW